MAPSSPTPARFYVTTPIYYINAAPHVGTAYSTIAADTLARYHRMRGHDVRFLTGTDEHGQKIERVAEERGQTPAVYADGASALFRDCWPKLGVEPDDFIRTTEPRHEERVQALWSKIAATGQIYLGAYEGWYCVADEAFYTEKELVDGLSPTGRPVERVKEPSYFFKLSDYTDKLLAFYEKHPTFVQPEGRFNEVKAFVKGGLQDLSVSRTSFTWGVPVPNDPAHVMYVWFDALSNYLTALGPEGAPERRFWPADVHLVGKEITRFHAVYWPAFLLAAGFSEDELPKQIYAHGWLTVNGEKMSKSLGNFLDPVPLAEAVGVDALRYYLLRAIAFGQDGDFDHKDLVTRMNSELANDLGNLLSRSLGLCTKLTEGKTPTKGPDTELETTLWDAARLAATTSAKELDATQPHRALEAIWAFCRAANTYVDRAAPWTAAKQGDTARVGTILATLLEACRWLSLLVAPVLPSKADEMRRQLGLGPIASGAPKDGAAPDPRLGIDLWPTTVETRAAGEPLFPGAPLFPKIDKPGEEALLAKLVPAKVAVEVAPAAADAAAVAAPGVVEKTPLAATIEYPDFEKVDLRVGKILAAVKVPKKDKLLDLQVDVGEESPRRIVAGIALSFPKPEELVGKQVVVVANLAPRDFGKGLISHGMLLAAGTPTGLSLVDPGPVSPTGTRVK
jgi:methionyl-tRNA synthetase